MRSDVGTLCIQLLVACVAASATALGQASAPPTLSVNVSSGRHPISAQVYGIANYGLDATYAKEIAVPNIRWGGDGTTRYNWQVDSSNAGFDWYFMGGSGTANPTPGGSADQMIRTYQPANALITIPIIPFVNKSAAWNCSFPVSVYGAQQSTNPYVHPNGDNCGNSIASNGTQLIDNNIYANHIDNSIGLQKGWLQHLVGTFGPAAQGGVAFYQLDNEPLGWGNTHRDVLPSGADYPTITQLGEQYAAAIKQVDPSAMVLGPSDFTLGGWVGDTTKQGGLLAGQYYLQQMAAYQATNGSRILDYFDEHYYFDVSSATAQLASTRTLWDPTFNGGTWVEQYVFNGPMQLLPRFKGWVSQYYPGTKIALSEYSIDSGRKSIVDAIAEMDVLGIFGREQLGFANMWSAPAPTDPIAYAFRMYRNYDGNGEQYGDTWVDAASSDQSQLSVYAAQRTSDSVVTILILNKTGAAISTTVALTGVSLPATASVYSYSSANLQQIVSETNAPINNETIAYSFAGYSATLFAFTPAAAPPSVTTTTLTASSTTLNTGQALTLTAVVSGSGSPTGIVSFKDGSSTIGSATLSGNKAIFSTSALSAGSHTLTAVYGGDPSDATSTSSPVTVTLTKPAPLSTSTVLFATPSQPTIGQSVILSAIVSGSGSPTGTVAFNDGGTRIGTATLTSGSASLSTSALSAGPHTITADYNGDANDATSHSNAAIVTVAQPAPAATTTTLTASSTQITTQQNLALSLSVSSATGTPTGTVILSDGATALASVPLANGAATFIDSNLAAGVHDIIAVYSGDATHTASTSAILSVTVTQPPVAPPIVPQPPAPASTTTALNASSTQLTAGQTLTLTAIVSTSTPSATGTITFRNAADTLGVVSLSHGLASITTSLNAGIQTIVANYSGDANDAASVSAPLTISVAATAPPPPAPQDFSLQLSQTAMTLAPGASGQIGFTIAPQNGFNQQLKLSCSGLPASANCSFSPATLTPAAAATGSITITVVSSTTATADLLLPISGILLFFRRRLSRFGAALAMTAFTLLIAGCGAGVNQTIGTATSAGPTAGNYTVQVTAATTTGLVHMQPMTLTVQ
ncbi:Ig-like domain repeat protein [Tunturibacter empetritectus]|uniref:Ig-like domain-containing protein n=1 Tax=Tunturiibacter lichenicola TaxID=2051959 RepID=A0A7W8J8P8_9BACT|nr:Ig-like domain repeat protein [Edaphobacter lichenicola]MBB5343377.1 hypothetical protein [Edaphobacter lichenicola]